jgi:Na+/citrate or Na+/malate symporter
MDAKLEKQVVEIYGVAWYYFAVFGIVVIAAAITPQYIALILAAVVGAILGAGIMGRLVGFYPIDSAITAGLCMTNMGGTGDAAVLSASKRMELMPFAQISSRIGGALILVLASFLIQI